MMMADSEATQTNGENAQCTKAKCTGKNIKTTGRLHDRHALPKTFGYEESLHEYEGIHIHEVIS